MSKLLPLVAAIAGLALTACADLMPPPAAATPPAQADSNVFCTGCTPGMDHLEMHEQRIHHTHPVDR